MTTAIVFALGALFGAAAVSILGGVLVARLWQRTMPRDPTLDEALVDLAKRIEKPSARDERGVWPCLNCGHPAHRHTAVLVDGAKFVCCDCECKALRIETQAATRHPYDYPGLPRRNP